MDNISLLKELNDSTIKKSKLEKTLEEFNIPEEDTDVEFGDEDPDVEFGDEDVDMDDHAGYADDIGLEDDELQDIVSWCEEECSDMSDDELREVLDEELAELDLEPEQLEEVINRVMSMLGREESSDMEDDFEDEGDDFEGDSDYEGDTDEEDYYGDDYPDDR